MIDTNPIFYQITMTGELLTTVLRGMYPVIQTRILGYIPVLTGHNLGSALLRTESRF